MNKPWKFDEEGFDKRTAHLDEYQKLNAVKSMLDYRLSMLENSLEKLKEDVEALENKFWGSRAEILIEEIDEFLEAPDENI
jgi:hypothetical protein